MKQDDRACFSRLNDRGVTIPIVALMLTALITMTAIAVDLGRLNVERRNMQADADVIALDLVRLADGRTEGAITADPSYLATLNRSAAANAIDPAELVVEYGTYSSGTGTFSPTGATEVPSAVSVRASRSIDYFFAPGGGSTNRTAIAALDNIASFSAGSNFVALDTGDSALLNALLASQLCPAPGGPPAPPTCSLAVAGVSYQGLASANISLQNIVDANASFATVDELLAADLTAAQFGTAVANAFSNNGDAANAAVFNQFVLQSTQSSSANAGDVIEINSPSNGAAADAEVNAFDLFQAFLQAANGSNFIDLNTVVPPISLAGITTINTRSRYRVVETPDIAIGPVSPSTVARSAQIRFEQGVDLSVNLAAGLGSFDLSLDYSIEGGSTRATLTEILCNDDPDLNTIDLSALDQALEGTIGDVDSPIQPIGTLNVALLPPIQIGISKSIPASADSPSFHNDMAVGEVRSTPGTNASLGLTVTSADITLSPSPPGAPAIKNAIASTLNAVLTELKTLSAPMLTSLGANISNGDLRHLWSRCGTPFLRI